MNLQERIKNSNLPIKQRRVIESILSDLESNSFLSGQEICQKFEISFSSLTRMAKSLDLKGFPQLKKEIETLYKNELSPSSQAKSFLENTSRGSILETVIRNEINALEKMKNSLNEEDLLAITKKIYSAERIFLIGVGQLGPIIEKLSQNLEILGKEVYSFKTIGFSKEIELYQISSSDIIILTSINKELSESYDFLNSLSTKDINSVLLSDRKYGRLQKVASSSLFAPSIGHGTLNNLAPFHILTNILESYLFSLDEHVHLKKIKKVEKGWNSLPIFLQ